MGFLDEDYDVGMAEGYVRQAESHLAYQKRMRERAKAKGEYRNCSKGFILPNGKLANYYDCNVYWAEIGLKERKQQLAKAKERAREAKKKKQEEAKKKKQEEVKKVAPASKTSSPSSSSRVSSASSAVISSVVSASVAASLSKSSPSYSEPSTNTHSKPSFSKSETVSSYGSRSNEISSNVNQSKEYSKTSIIILFFIFTLIAFVGIYLLYIWYDSCIQWWDTIWQILCYVFVFPYIVLMSFAPLHFWFLKIRKSKKNRERLTA